LNHPQVEQKMRVKATALHSFHGNLAQQQISFPAGAEIEADRNHENNGWMAGSYMGQKGWFPVSYVSFPPQPMPQPQPLWQHPQPPQQMHNGLGTTMISNRNMENLPVGGGGAAAVAVSAFPDHVYDLVDGTGQNQQQPQQRPPVRKDFVDWSGKNQQPHVVQPAALAPFGAATTGTSTTSSNAMWTTTPSYSTPQSTLAYVQDDDFCFGNQEIMGGLGTAIARQAPLQPISNYKNDNDDQDNYQTHQDSGKGNQGVVGSNQPPPKQQPQQTATSAQQPPKNKSKRFRFFTKKG
jgi:hypothetical protein